MNSRTLFEVCKSKLKTVPALVCAQRTKYLELDHPCWGGARTYRGQIQIRHERVWAAGRAWKSRPVVSRTACRCQPDRRRRKQLLRDRLAPFADQPKLVFVLSRWERGAVGDPVLLGGPKRAPPVKARPPIIRHPAGMPPGVAARDPDSGIFGGFGRRRRKLRLSQAPHLPWRKSAIDEANHFRSARLFALGARRSRGGGKLNDVAHCSAPG